MSHVLCGWSGALRSLLRRFQIRESLGPAVSSVTGCPEGCSMSCLGMALINLLYHHWMQAQCPGCMPMSYVDDWQILTSHVEQTMHVMHSLETFTTRVDLLLDKQKTYAWSTDPKGRRHLKLHRISTRRQAKSLGAQMQYTKSHGAKVIHDRIRDLKQMWQRLRMSLSPYFLKVRVLSRAAWPKGLHGVSATNVGPTVFRSLRAGAMRGLDSDGSGCSSWVHLGLVESPEADPQYWAVKETIRCTRLCQNEAQISMLCDLAVGAPSCLPSGGPTIALVHRLQYVGWTIHPGMVVEDSWGKFSLFAISMPELLTRLEKSWQYVVAAKMEARPCFQGLRCADPKSTRRFLSLLPLPEQGLYRKALNGAAFTNDVLCYFNDTGCNLCKFCGAVDSRKHRFWKCPAFGAERSFLPEGFVELAETLPACATQAGWALQSETQDEWWRYLNSLDVGPPQPFKPAWADMHGWVDVFTDGSCFMPTRENVRFASWSCCRAHPALHLQESEVIAAGALPGILQSAFRAELFAVSQALAWATGSKCKIRLWTDCQGVVTKLQGLLGGTWKPAPNVNHSNLWEQIVAMVEKLSPENCQITKVAAHQSIQQASTPLENWAFLHNSLADRAACLANLCRPESFWTLHRKHVEAVDCVQHVNKAIQRLILDVSKRVLVRDAIEAAAEPKDGDVTPGPAAPLKTSAGLQEWRPLTVQCMVPSQVSQKFGHRLTALVGAWFDEAQQLAQVESAQPQWIAWYQMLVDFQLRTGEPGPYFDGGWQDPAIRVILKARPFQFRKRCAWFVKLVKSFLHHNDIHIQQQVTRPASNVFALHTSSVWCVWSMERLQMVEQWVSSKLSRAATRDGRSLDSLPVAKQSAEQSPLNVLPGPLGF